MAIATLEEWEIAQIKAIGCNFFSPKDKENNVFGEKQNDIYPVGFCSLKTGICRGIGYCPFWR